MSFSQLGSSSQLGDSSTSSSSSFQTHAKSKASSKETKKSKFSSRTTSNQSKSTKGTSKKNDKEVNDDFKKKLNEKSETCLKNDEIYRQFRVSVKQADDYIDKISTLSENRIQEKVANIFLESQLNLEMDTSSKVLSTLQQDYLKEVDLSLDQRAQLRAQRQYHLTQIESLLPEWCQVLIKVKEVIGGCGHLNKLQWRSKAKTLLTHALELMEQEQVTSAIEEAINTFRHLILSINAYPSQRILSILSEVKERYLKEIDSSEEGSLGFHCRQLREVEAKYLKRPVPLLREEWSEEILSEINLKDSLNKSSILRTMTSATSPDRLQQSQQQHSQQGHWQQQQQQEQSFSMHTLESHSVFSNSNSSSVYETETDYGEKESSGDEIRIGYPSEFSSASLPSAGATGLAGPGLGREGEPSVPITSQPLLFPPPDKICNTTTAHQYLRSLATKGKFREAWGVFNSLYGEYIVYPVKRKHTSPGAPRVISLKETHFLKFNLRNKPTLETFKLLFLGLKNSLRYDPYDIYSLLSLMKRLEITPDIFIYNMILRICEQKGAWRRALEFLKHLQHTYGSHGNSDNEEPSLLLPNTNTYAILVDCCRHSVEDSPAEIFETLRNAGLPRKFCYQAAMCNAGNRLSSEVTSHMFHDTYDPFSSSSIPPPASASPASASFSSTSLPSPQSLPHQLSSYLVTQQRLSPSTAFPSPSVAMPKAETLRAQRKWKSFEDNVRSTLHWQSTAKHPTGPSTHRLTVQLAKLMFPVERRDLETSQLLKSHHHSSQEIFHTIASASSSFPPPLSLSPSRTFPSVSSCSSSTTTGTFSKTPKLKPIVPLSSSPSSSISPSVPSSR